MAEHPHLSIGEVLSLLQAEFPDVTISKIRFLESQGLLDPERTPSGYRKFYEADIERLRWILAEQRDNFLPLRVIKDRLEEQGGEPSTGEIAAAEGEPAGVPGELDLTDEAGPDVEVVPDEPETLPIWMADLARQQAFRKAAAAAGDPAANLLDDGPSEVSLTLHELASASGLGVDQITELEQFGLIEADKVGADVLYGGDAVVVVQKAAGLFKQGLTGRHLRSFKVAADREAGLFEQMVMPLLKQRSPAARREAVERLGDLTDLAGGLRGALLRQALRSHFKPGG